MQFHSPAGPHHLLIIACLLAAAGAPAMAADGTSAVQPAGGTISVFTFPGGAAVELNGEYRGKTPLLIDHIPPGEYLLTISLTGYWNESFPLILSHGSRRDIGVNLENLSIPRGLPGTGSVAIDSRPGGASVVLDGNPVGKTPEGHAALILDSVPTGVHTVTVDLAGYLPYSGNVTVHKNQVVQVNADLAVPAAVPGTVVTTAGDRGNSRIPPATSTVVSGSSTMPVPLSPLAAAASFCLATLLAVFRRT